MQFTQHALSKIGEDTDLHKAVFLAATEPTVRYESRRNGGGMRHVRGDVVAIVDRGAVITFYRNVVETPLRADQTDADALAHAAEVKAQSRKAREQARNARRDRDRALTTALKGRKA
jgi:hypothetical protein